MPPPQALESDPGDEEQPVRRDSHRVVSRDDVTDLAMLPRHVRFLAGELRELAGVLREQVVPALKRIEERQASESAHLDGVTGRIYARLDRIEQRLTPGAE